METNYSTENLTAEGAYERRLKPRYEHIYNTLIVLCTHNKVAETKPERDLHDTTRIAA